MPQYCQCYIVPGLLSVLAIPLLYSWSLVFFLSMTVEVKVNISTFFPISNTCKCLRGVGDNDNHNTDFVIISEYHLSVYFPVTMNNCKLVEHH